MESKGGHYGILDIFAYHGIIDSIYYDRNWKILYEKTAEKNQQRNRISDIHVHEKQNNLGICPRVLRKDLVSLRTPIIADIRDYHVPCDRAGQGYHRKCRTHPVRRSNDYFGRFYHSYGNRSEKEV